MTAAATAPGAAKQAPPRKGSAAATAAAPSAGSAAPSAGSAAPTAPPANPPAAAPTPSAPKLLVTDKLFRIELAPLAPCKTAAACEARLIVHSLGGYKVNAEYPTKFVATASPALTVTGTGTFAVADKTTGTMTIAFRAVAAGTAPVSGVLKLSVCTDEICEIAAPAVSFDVPVTAP